MQQMRNVILIVLAVLVYHSSYAQDPRLYDNNWYFASGELNGVTLEPPFPSFVTILTFNSNPPFEEILIDYVTCEETHGSTLIYNPTENIFNIQGGFGGLVGTCTYNFMYDHLEVYWDDDLDVPKNPFNYTIIDDGNYLQLTIFNGNGDHVVYNNFQLSIVDFDVLSFSIHPNPVKDELFFPHISDSDYLDVFIFDLHGKLVKSINHLNSESINLQDLQAGLYFIRLNDNLGRTVIKKLTKS
ncbi:MAG: T9SS C-terminal target domain-containing protein [Planctomycetes bacterium]|nr:T9SS C-terminal target domain-containing protein [Planctomycetota bacterium]